MLSQKKSPLKTSMLPLHLWTPTVTASSMQMSSRPSVIRIRLSLEPPRKKEKNAEGRRKQERPREENKNRWRETQDNNKRRKPRLKDNLREKPRRVIRNAKEEAEDSSKALLPLLLAKTEHL